MISSASLRPRRAAGMVLVVAVLLCAGLIGRADARALVVHGVATLPNGAPVVKDTVQIHDSAGGSKTASTNGAGRYSANLAGMTPPFLIAAGPAASSSVLFSVAQGAGIANVDVVTDLIVSMVYKAQGTTSAAQFSGQTVPVPTRAQVGLVATLVKNSLLRWILADKLKPAKVNLIATPFAANGKGFDALLHRITVVNNDYEITLSDGTTTQDSNYTADAGAGSVKVSTSTTSTTGSAGSTSSTAIPSGPSADAETAALNGVNTLLSNFQNAVNAAGKSLAVSNISGFFDNANYLDEGENAQSGIADFATFLRGIKLSGTSVADIRKFQANTPDASHNLIDVDFATTASLGTATSIKTRHEVFTCDLSGSNCLFYGDQQPAATAKGVQISNLLENNPPISGPAINVDLAAPTGTISSVTISGAAPFSSPNAVPFGFTKTKKLSPTPSTELDFTEDDFTIPQQPVSPIPAPGTDYIFNMNLSGGGSAIGDSLVTAVTGEPINLVSPPFNGGTSIGDAPLGSTLTVKWTLPLTYALNSIGLSGYVCANGHSEQLNGNQKLLATTATQGTITFPKTMSDGTSILSAAFNLEMKGIGGEESLVIYLWGGGC